MAKTIIDGVTYEGTTFGRNKEGNMVVDGKEIIKDIRLYYIGNVEGIRLNKYGRYKRHHKFPSYDKCKDFIENNPLKTDYVKQFVIVEYTGTYDAKIIEVIEND